MSKPTGVCGLDNCPSTRYHEEHGFWYCEQGHQQEAVVEGEDEDDFNTQGQTTRRKKDDKEKTYRHLRGRKAFELYLLSYQLILWKQTHYLVTIKGLPAEFQILVKDLWTLRLQNLANRVDEDDPASDAATDTQSQLFSSQSEAETDTDGERLFRKGRNKDASPKLLEALALCYLGMVLLRLPYTPGDLTNWATKGELLYYRAIKELPREMREQLPGVYHEALDPPALLRPGTVQHNIAQVALLYARDFGMQFPPLNRPLLTFRFIKELALPLDVYSAVAQLADVVGYALEYPHRGTTTSRFRVVDFPEPQLISLVVVAAKLLYPLDRVRRYPSAVTEPAAMRMDWEAWASAFKDPRGDQAAQAGRLTFEKAMRVEEKDVFAMSGKELDSYLDFYEQTWTDENTRERGRDRDFRQALYKMFPTGHQHGSMTTPNQRESEITVAEQPGSAVKERLAAVMDAMKPGKIISETEADEIDQEVPRPGSYYKRHRMVATLNGPEKLFHEEAARMVGLSLKSLVSAVFLTERLIQRRQEGKSGETVTEELSSNYEDI